MQRRAWASLAMAASTLAACHTVERPVRGEALEYAAAPVSMLVSKQALQFKVAQVQRDETQLTVLAYQSSGAKPSPVAMISSARSDDQTRVSIRRVSPPGAGGDRGDLNTATIEYLYALAMRLDPEAKFCFSDGDRQCNAASDGYSHPALLRELARARQRAVEQAGHESISIPWQVVYLAPGEVKPAGPDEVGVRISSDQGPMGATTIYFNRAPHSSCAAKSGENGYATCILVDQHGDEESHSGNDKVPVLATFPGVVRADRILLPTTLFFDSKR
jgi:hypothetical protein